MTRAERIAFFTAIAQRHIPALGFEESPRRLKESNRSDIAYPVLVMDDEPDISITGGEDNLLEDTRPGLLILVQANSEASDDINIAWQTARALTRDVISYVEEYNRILRENDELLLNYIDVVGEKIRAIHTYSSDKLYGYRLSLVDVEAVNYVFDPAKWTEI